MLGKIIKSDKYLAQHEMKILKIVLMNLLLLQSGKQNYNKLLFATNKICVFVLNVICLFFLQGSFNTINIPKNSRSYELKDAFCPLSEA